jgi:hypothetical protein
MNLAAHILAAAQPSNNSGGVILLVINPGLQADPLSPRIITEAVMAQATQPTLQALRASKPLLTNEHMETTFPVLGVTVSSQNILLNPVDLKVTERLLDAALDDSSIPNHHLLPASNHRERMAHLQSLAQKRRRLLDRSLLAPERRHARVVHPLIDQGRIIQPRETERQDRVERGNMATVKVSSGAGANRVSHGGWGDGINDGARQLHEGVRDLPESALEGTRDEALFRHCAIEQEEQASLFCSRQCFLARKKPRPLNRDGPLFLRRSRRRWRRRRRVQVEIPAQCRVQHKHRVRVRLPVGCDRVRDPEHVRGQRRWVREGAAERDGPFGVVLARGRVQVREERDARDVRDRRDGRDLAAVREKQRFGCHGWAGQDWPVAGLVLKYLVRNCWICGKKKKQEVGKTKTKTRPRNDSRLCLLCHSPVHFHNSIPFGDMRRYLYRAVSPTHVTCWCRNLMI